jgi:hypothetical protein
LLFSPSCKLRSRPSDTCLIFAPSVPWPLAERSSIYKARIIRKINQPSLNPYHGDYHHHLPLTRGLEGRAPLWDCGDAPEISAHYQGIAMADQSPTTHRRHHKYCQDISSTGLRPPASTWLQPSHTTPGIWPSYPLPPLTLSSGNGTPFPSLVARGPVQTGPREPAGAH